MPFVYGTVGERKGTVGLGLDVANDNMRNWQPHFFDFPNSSWFKLGGS